MLLLEVTSRSPARRCVYHVHNHQGSGPFFLSASMRSSCRPFGFFATGSESDASSSSSCHVSYQSASPTGFEASRPAQDVIQLSKGTQRLLSIV